MRYFTEKPKYYTTMFGETYHCNHPIYNTCTLYKIGYKGVSVIQQRYDAQTKHTYWTEIDPWLCDILYLAPGFKDFFNEYYICKGEQLLCLLCVKSLWMLL